MEIIAREERATARVEYDRMYNFNKSIRRLMKKCASNTNDPQFQMKVCFNYKEKITQINVVKDINGDAKFLDPDREFVDSNLSLDFGSIQMPKINFKNNNKFVVLHELSTPKDLIRIRNIDEDGKFISAAFLSNLPIMIKSSDEFVEKFNEKIRHILKRKYSDRSINIDFDNYNAIPKKRCTIMQYV
jgi:hypothetical protein